MSGEIEITLRQQAADEAVLSVSDTGIGMPDGLDIEQTTTLGLQLVGLLIDQLGGTMTMQRANPTRLVLRFPVT
jgi:two-component sensor histidine kinase